MKIATIRIEEIEPQVELADVAPAVTEAEYQMLKDSIAAEGIEVPILVGDLDGTKYIVDGYTRWCIAKELGIDEIPAQGKLYSTMKELIVDALKLNIERRQMHGDNYTALVNRLRKAREMSYREAEKEFGVSRSKLHRQEQKENGVLPKPRPKLEPVLEEKKQDALANFMNDDEELEAQQEIEDYNKGFEVPQIYKPNKVEVLDKMPSVGGVPIPQHNETWEEHQTKNAEDEEFAMEQKEVDDAQRQASKQVKDKMWAQNALEKLGKLLQQGTIDIDFVANGLGIQKEEVAKAVKKVEVAGRKKVAAAGRRIPRGSQGRALRVYPEAKKLYIAERGEMKPSQRIIARQVGWNTANILP